MTFSNEPSLKESLRLWLPPKAELSLEEREDQLERVTNCNDALTRLILGEIDLDTCFDIVEANDVDMDDYLIVTLDNVEYHFL